MHESRVRKLNEHKVCSRPILYWMDREMRLHDNWALLYALKLAKEQGVGVGIVYNLVADYLGGGERQLVFKRSALHELADACKELHIPFFVLPTSHEADDVVRFIRKIDPGAVVTDMNPLRVNRSWKDQVARTAEVAFFEVDAHNVVPVWVTSEKQEFAARTIRPKIHRNLSTYLTDFPRFNISRHTWKDFPHTDWKRIDALVGDATVVPVSWIVSGERAAKRALRAFIDERLVGYAEGRNDPNADAFSNLSPYFHYGMLSPQRAAYEVWHAHAPLQDREAFLEEAVVRRELSDNFCFYHSSYDQVAGFPLWAQKTLRAHLRDKREFVYTKHQFEHAQTHDALWNAAQKEMVVTGKMHGYMRMYWAKKILEWTKSPEDALRIALDLNDRYELDGRDPNGYVGCAWAIGGLHDRPWGERPIFGQVRYMNAAGCARKFDVRAYIDKYATTPLF